ncbi:MAG: glycosyltransferase family 4 protein [Verrucomicrobiaceae bacterium]|jgi:glycosyltransferase involved in cell wall biosynthesis
MRIALVHYSAPPVIGGVERVIGEQQTVLQRMGHEAELVCGKATEVLQALNSSTFDLVIVHNVFTMPFDLALTRDLRELAASSTSTKWINWVHDVAAVNPNYAHLAWESAELQMLKTAPLNCTPVAVSEIRQIEYCGLTELLLEQCRVIPNGVDVAKVLNLSPRVVDLIEPLRLWERDFVLVHPARILRRKNIELGLRVVKALQRDSLDVAYLISGAPDPHNKDGLAYGSELQTLVQELGLLDSAFFLGEAGPLSDDDVRSLYSVSDALLFPSKSEGFGLPLVEAALHGLPVFCSDIAAHREIGQSVGNFFDLDEDPALIACSIAEHPEVEARYVRRTTLAGWLDWSKIAVTYLEPLLHDVTNP